MWEALLIMFLTWDCHYIQNRVNALSSLELKHSHSQKTNRVTSG